MQRRHRYGDDRVAAEPRLVRRAVQLDQPTVDLGLVGDRHHRNAAAISPFRCGDRAIDPKPAKGGSAVPQLDRLVRAGRGAGRRDRAPARRRRSSKISASTVGRPRKSQTRRPIMRAIVAALIRPPATRSLRFRPPRPRRIRARRAGGSASSDRATRRTRSLSRSSVRYSTGDLPSMRARRKAGQQMRRAPVDLLRGGSQSTPLK